MNMYDFEDAIGKAGFSVSSSTRRFNGVCEAKVHAFGKIVDVRHYDSRWEGPGWHALGSGEHAETVKGASAKAVITKAARAS
jgi:hypothetical protein